MCMHLRKTFEGGRRGSEWPQQKVEFTCGDDVVARAGKRDTRGRRGELKVLDELNPLLWQGGAREVRE